MAKKEQVTYALEDHMCKRCGGRILRRVGGPSIITPGGNPLYVCSDCGASVCDMSCYELCWCGFNHKNQTLNPYQCVPFSALETNPELREQFLACGCNPDAKTSQIGIIMINSNRH